MTGRILRKNKRCVKVKHKVAARLTSGGLLEPKLWPLSLFYPAPSLLANRPPRRSRGRVRLHERSQTRDPGVQAGGVAGVAPAYKPLSFGTERAAGRKS